VDKWDRDRVVTAGFGVAISKLTTGVAAGVTAGVGTGAGVAGDGTIVGVGLVVATFS
jgi:hypothetical protein